MLVPVLCLCLFVVCVVGNDKVTRDEAEQKCLKFNGLLADLMYNSRNTSVTERKITGQLQNGESVWTSKFVVYSNFYSWIGCVAPKGENDVLKDAVLEREKTYQCMQYCNSTETTFNYFGVGYKSCYCLADIKQQPFTLLHSQCQGNTSSDSVYRLYHGSFNWNPDNRETQQCVYATKTEYRAQVQYGTTSCDDVLDGFICLERVVAPNSVSSKSLSVVTLTSSLSQAQLNCQRLSKFLLWTETTQNLFLQPSLKYWTGITRSFQVSVNDISQTQRACLSLKRVNTTLTEIPDDCNQLKHAPCSRATTEHAPGREFIANDGKYATETTGTYIKTSKTRKDVPAYIVGHSIHYQQVTTDSVENSSPTPTRNATTTDGHTNTSNSEITGILTGILAAIGGTGVILIVLFGACTLRKLRSKESTRSVFTVNYISSEAQRSNMKKYTKINTQDSETCDYIHPIAENRPIMAELKEDVMTEDRTNISFLTGDEH